MIRLFIILLLAVVALFSMVECDYHLYNFRHVRRSQLPYTSGKLPKDCLIRSFATLVTAIAGIMILLLTR